MSARIMVVTVVAGGLLFVSSAGAQSEEGRVDPIRELGEIIVSGDSPRVVERAGTVDVVTAEDIERSGARTLEEAIDLLPAVTVRVGGDGRPRIDVRGMRTRNLLIFLDGVPLNSTFDGQFDPAAIPVENIAAVKVTRGGSSVLYGPGGNGGVINIITRGASEGVNVSLQAEHGFEESDHARGFVSGRAGDVGLVMSGSWFDQSYYEVSDDFSPTPLQPGDRRVNSDREDAALFGSVSWDPSDALQLGLSLGYREGEFGKPPSTVDRSASDFARRVRFERADFEQVNLHAAADWRVSERVTLRPSFFVNDAEERTDRFDDDGFVEQQERGSFSEDATTTITGTDNQLAWAPTSGSLFSVAAAFREEEWSATGFTVERVRGGGGGGGGGGSSTTVERIDAGHAVDIYSIAAEYEVARDKPASFVFGIGQNWINIPGRGRVDDTSFTVGAVYAQPGLPGLHASIARKIRFPTLRDLFAADRGNPDLNPEVTLNYEVGVEHTFRQLPVTGGVTLFRIDAEEFIERIDGGRTQNFEELRFQGAEVELGYAPTTDSRFRFSYTLLDSENRSPDAPIETLQNRPRHKLAFRADHDFAFGAEAQFELVHNRERYVLSRGDADRAKELDDYTVVNMAVAQPLWNDRVWLTLRAENLLDADYAESFGFEQPGRTVFVGLKLK